MGQPSRVLVVLAFAGLLAAPVALAEPKSLNTLWKHELRGETPQGIVVDRAGRPFLYVTLKSGGLVVLRTARPADGPQEVARIPIRNLGNLDAMHLTQQGNRLYLALGDLFAPGGSQAGLAIVEVTDPTSPQVLGVWSSVEKLQGSATVVVDHDNAYLGAMSAGVLILDIRDPANIQLQSKFRPDPDFPRPNPNSLQRPNARGLALVGNRLFVAYDAGGVRILDVANRQQPQEIGRYINLGMGQKQQAYNNLIVDGDRLYAAIDYAGLEILDIKRVDAIRQVGWWNPWKAHTLQNLWFNSPGHTNQLEFDRKQQRIYLSAGDSELQVVDVAKPDHPQLVAQHGQSQNGLGTWGVALDENAAYLTYMTAIVPFRGTWAGVAAIKRN